MYNGRHINLVGFFVQNYPITLCNVMVIKGKTLSPLIWPFNVFLHNIFGKFSIVSICRLYLPDSSKDPLKFVLWKQQKKPSRSVLRTKCSENMHQIYRRPPNAEVRFHWNRTSAGLFSCKFSACFQNIFS